MVRLVYLHLALTIGAVVLAAPRPQDGVDGDVFGDPEGDVFDDDDKEDVEGDVFEDDYEGDYYPEDDYDATFGSDETTEAPKKHECPTDRKQFLIDLRSNHGTSNDCNKTAKCTEYLGVGFSCVPYWQCKDIDTNVISDGDGLIDLREDSEEGSGSCVAKRGILDASDEKCPDHENLVCCKNSNPEAEICRPENPTPEEPTPTATKRTVVTVPGISPGSTPSEPIQIPTKPPNKVTRRMNKPISFDECGRTSSGLKVQNLKDVNAAQPGEFTHMCIIYKNVKGSRVYVGGASLIDKNKLITVAHKFYLKHGSRNTIDERDNVDNLLVRCGEYNVKTEAELTEYQETTVAAIHVHPLYDPADNYLPNNLVILETKQNFIYQDHIGPVCLPQPDDEFEKARCWSSGWGKDQFGSNGFYSDVLKKVEMGIVPPLKCENDLREALKNKSGSTTTDFRLDPSHLCIGGKKEKDTCTGDGGSPHSCKIGEKGKEKWTQVGTVAWGISCGTEVPAIYSSIPDAMCWIDHLMSCVKPAETDINGEPDDEGDLINLRVVGERDCSKYSRVLSSCQMYQNTFDKEV